jgi:hypothetical protein
MRSAAAVLEDVACLVELEVCAPANIAAIQMKKMNREAIDPILPFAREHWRGLQPHGTRLRGGRKSGPWAFKVKIDARSSFGLNRQFGIRHAEGREQRAESRDFSIPL